MKYLVLCLILIMVALARAPARAREDLPTYGSASFLGTSSGISTKVEIDVNESAGAALLTLSVNQDVRTCDHAGVCRDRPLISGLTLQNASPNEAGADRILGRAFVYTTIRFHDDISNAEIPVRVDAIWTDPGPQVCDPQILAGLYNTIECVRTASITADVAIGSTLLIDNQTVTDGELVWQLAGT